jgi:mono/diheme cytochrome c family protein
MSKFTAGFIIGILIVLAIPFAILATGSINVAALEKPGIIERTVAPWARDRSIARREPHVRNPLASDPAAISQGLAHYKANCVTCHGAPGVATSELARGLNPAPPKLDTEDIRSTPDGELFWVIKNGIRMTGMPGFGITHTDDEIWKIVAFVRHLNALTPTEKAALRTAVGEDHHTENGPAAEEGSPGASSASAAPSARTKP